MVTGEVAKLWIYFEVELTGFPDRLGWAMKERSNPRDWMRSSRECRHIKKGD